MMNNWQSVEVYQQPSVLNDSQWQWLSDQGSLTQRLRQFSKGQIRHQLKWADWGHPYPEEAQLLHLLSSPELNANHIKVWLREITWQYQQQVWVYGRVVIPESTLINTHGRLQQLPCESLGDTLFADPSIRRTKLELNCLTPPHVYYHLALNAKLAVSSNFTDLPDQLWSRRSLFHYQNQPLLVVEIFLPEFFNALVSEQENYAVELA